MALLMQLSFKLRSSAAQTRHLIQMPKGFKS